MVIIRILKPKSDRIIILDNLSPQFPQIGTLLVKPGESIEHLFFLLLVISPGDILFRHKVKKKFNPISIIFCNAIRYKSPEFGIMEKMLYFIPLGINVKLFFAFVFIADALYFSICQTLQLEIRRLKLKVSTIRKEQSPD